MPRGGGGVDPGVDPLNPTLAISPAAHIAAIVSVRIRRGVNQEKPRPRVCSHVRKPVAAEAPAIAHPTHIYPEYSLIAGFCVGKAAVA